MGKSRKSHWSENKNYYDGEVTTFSRLKESRNTNKSVKRREERALRTKNVHDLIDDTDDDFYNQIKYERENEEVDLISDKNYIFYSDNK